MATDQKSGVGDRLELEGGGAIDVADKPLFGIGLPKGAHSVPVGCMRTQPIWIPIRGNELAMRG
jgi:hypothetical protein